MTTQAQKERSFSDVKDILERYDYNPSNVIPILQAAQDQYRYLPEDVMLYISTALGIPPARVYGVATFYSQFSTEPKGKYVIQICDGTACHVDGSVPLNHAAEEHLGVDEDNPTTDDMLFTLERVACLGACSMAPLILVGGEFYGHMNPEKLRELVDEIRSREGRNRDAEH